MDAITRRAVAKVTATDKLGGQIRGTAFLVSDSVVITAWHVVQNAVAIDLDFPGFHTTGQVLARGKEGDSDIVALRSEESVPAQPLPVGYFLGSDRSWETYGYPAYNPNGAAPAGDISFEGDPQHASAIELFSKQLAAGTGAQVPGLSGAPCMVGGSVVAVINEAITDSRGVSQAGTIYARLIGPFIEQLSGLVRLPDPLRRGLPGLPNQELPNLPFRLIQNYGPEHAEVFFGRSRDISALYSQVSDPETPVVQLLYGQTGVGKSSLVAAGLVPRLEAFHEVRLMSRSDYPTLTASLEQAIRADGGNLAAAWRWAEAGDRSLVVFIDQVEESFTRGQSPDEEWARFLEVITPFVQPPGRIRGKIVLSFRKEWLAEIVDRLNRAGVAYQQMLLNRLDADGVHEVVTGLTCTRRLARRYRLSVEPGLDVIIKNAILIDPGSSAAPALQILMTRMWEEASRINANAPCFDEDLFRRVTRDKGLYLDNFLDAQLKEIAAADADAIRSGLALDLLYFCTTGTGTSEARKEEQFLQEYRHLPPTRVTAVVRVLKDYKLLGDLHEGDGGRLMHDALGPLVHDRFHHSQAPGQRARRILETKASGWADGKQGDLIGKADLLIVEAGLNGMRAPNAAEQRAIEESRKAVDRQRKLAFATYAALAVLSIVAVVTFLLLRGQDIQRKMLSVVQDGSSASLIANEPGLAAEAMARAIGAIGKAELNGLPWYPEARRGLTLALSAGSESRALCCANHADVHAVDFSPDGRLVASGSGEGVLRIWDAGTGQQLHCWKHPSAGDKAVFGLAFAARAGLLATVPFDGVPALWNVDGDGKPLQLERDPGYDGPRYQSVRFAHHHDWLVAAGSYVGGGLVTVWNSDGGRPSSKSFQAAATFAEYSPADEEIAVGFGDGSIRRFSADLTDLGKPVLRHRESGEIPIQTVFYSPAGDSIVSSPRYHDGQLIVWDAATSQRRCVLINASDTPFEAAGNRVVREHGFGPLGAVFSPTGDELLVATWEHLVLRVDARSCAVTERIAGHTGSVYSVRYSPDGERFVSAGAGDSTARIWHFGTGPAISVIKAKKRITAAAFAPDGETVFGGTEDGSVVTWDSRSGKELSRDRSHPQEVFVARFSADGQTRLTASRDGTVEVHSKSGKHRVPAPNQLLDVSLSPDGKHVLTTTLYNVSEWDLDGGNAPHNCCGLPPPQRWMERAEFSPFDSRMLATIVRGGAKNARIQVWNRDARNGWSEKKGLPELNSLGNGNVRSFSKDGGLLATAWSDSIARIFDTTNGRLWPLRGHTNEVTSAVFSPVGYTIATGSIDGTVRLWDRKEDGDFVPWGIIRVGAPVLDVDFTGDGSRILARGSDGVVRIYAAVPRDLLAQGCRWLRYAPQFKEVEPICAPYVRDMKPAAASEAQLSRR